MLNDIDYTKNYDLPYTIIVGHVPTCFISVNDYAEPYKIYTKYRTDGSAEIINVDCGLGFGAEKLGLLCLETGEEFYI